jgi:DNA-binding transcriptional LysR family regulator
LNVLTYISKKRILMVSDSKRCKWSANKNEEIIMDKSHLSLRGLEVFQLTAGQGSVQAAARETGLSTSTVSHHLRSLEDQLGVALLDHGRRPMTLTPAGAVFLKNIDEALNLIRKAHAEVTLGNMTDARNLRLGQIEDFDSDIGPELAVLLANGMPKCDFAHYTRFSSEIFDMLHAQKLDIGIASHPSNGTSQLKEFPMLRDPFVLAIPGNCTTRPEEFLTGSGGLPMLRYARDQQIRKQIDAQLRRLKIDLPVRFEVESNQMMMAMIAAGSGWAVTTPTCYFRARRFHGQVRLHPFPAKGFARHLSLFAREECADEVIGTINSAMRNLIEMRLIHPAIEATPWLSDELYLLPSTSKA